MNTDKVAVSVLMTTYNHEKYISQAIESVLSQQVDFKYEIVIGDDASSDNTPKIIEEYVLKYPEIIRFVKREQNIGATRNSYELNLMCKGDYIAPLEADDYWIDPLKLQKQKNLLDSHPEYLGCSTDMIFIDRNGEILSHYCLEWYRPKKVFSISDFDGFHLPAQTSTYMRRNIFRNPRFDYSIMYSVHPQVGDRTCLAVYLLHGDIYHINEKMSAYRIPLGRKDCGTNMAYNNKLVSIKIDIAHYSAIKTLLDQHGIEMKSDYAARKICYSALIAYIQTKDRVFIEYADNMLSNTRNKFRTHFLLLPFLAKKMIVKIVNRVYTHKLEQTE